VIRNLSVAVLINRAALAAGLGDKATPDAIDKQVKEIEQLVTSAGGIKRDRGDDIKISVVDFVDSSKDLEPVAGESYLEILEHQTGTFVSAAAILLVAGMLIWFGLRPVTRALLDAPGAGAVAESSEGGGDFAIQSALPDLMGGDGSDGPLMFQPAEAPDAYFDALMERREKGPQRQLQKLIDFDEEQAVAILKQWIREGAST
jgi:flagellar M-ring protein FliF